jgi:ABC-type Mn2+/Zn2+ transport system ATPase subunit
VSRSHGIHKADPLIEFRDVALGYGREAVVRHLNMTIGEGDFLGLVGPNGSGKTTILRAILGILKPLEGSIHVRSGDFRPGYVPQRGSVDDLLPFTSEEVVMMGRYRDVGLGRYPGPADAAIVRDSLRSVGMEEHSRSRFNTLSGGQKQRVLIARALASRPTVLILDEPTNGMDLTSRASTLDLIRNLHQNERLTVLLVTHLLDDVANLVKRIALIDRSFFHVGFTDEVLTSRHLTDLYRVPVEVRQLHGKKVIFPGRSDGGD